MSDEYARYSKALFDEPLPAALVDLDAIDRNVGALIAPVRAARKKLRVASKSIRCLDLLQYVVDKGGEVVRGIMSFSVAEAAYLVASGFDDVFVAYPTGRSADAARLAELNDDKTTVCIAVDEIAHLELLNAAAAEANKTIPVVVDVDMSLRLFGDRLHVGVRRSPLSAAADVVALARRISGYSNLRMHGVMGYEAQIAGVTDDSPFSSALNKPKRAMKRLSRPHVERVRREIAAGLAEARIELTLFNGGGSGSLRWATREDALTEVTAGSGFLGSHLFDYYQDLDVAPGILFAVQVVRRPANGIVTCHGGGYVASGEAGPDRLPRPHLPRGLELLPLEGAGEVQTPLRVPPGTNLALGDPVFFRHAKAGELAEHFNTYLFVRGDRIVHRAPTYRGAGFSFL